MLKSVYQLRTIRSISEFTQLFELGSVVSVPDREADENIEFIGEMLSIFIRRV
jgi:hypothetical protein